MVHFMKHNSKTDFRGQETSDSLEFFVRDWEVHNYFVKCMCLTVSSTCSSRPDQLTSATLLIEDLDLIGIVQEWGRETYKRSVSQSQF